MRKLEGIRRRRNRWQAYVDVGGRDGKQVTKLFPLTTPIEEIRTWREDQIKKHDPAETAPLGGSFADDVQKYLKRITAQPTAPQKAAHLALWVQALGGTRTRRSITAEEIEVICNDWMTEPTPPAARSGKRGRPPGSPTGLSVATVRKRRTSLQSFFNRLDGKKSKHPNPAKGAELPPAPKAETRGIEFPLLERVLAAMPTYRDTKPGAPRVLSLAKLCARVIAYTGLPPGVLNDVTETDLRLDGPKPTVRALARLKGGGVEPRTLHLNPDGRAAFAAFHAADAYGKVPAGVNLSIKRAAAKAGIPWGTFRLYDVRHSYLAQVYRVKGDLATVGRLGLHAEGSVMTARYARIANEAVDAAAQQAFSASLKTLRRQTRQAAVPKPAPVLHTRPALSR